MMTYFSQGATPDPTSNNSPKNTSVVYLPVNRVQDKSPYTCTQLLSLQHISYQLPHGEFLFDNVSLDIQAKRIGLVGPNGAGKSMLLKLIAGEVLPSKGLIQRYTQMIYVPQNIDVSPSMAMADLLGMRYLLDAYERMTQGLAQQSDFNLLEGYWDTPTRLQNIWAATGLPQLTWQTKAITLSAGQRMKAILAAVFSEPAKLLLLDEPTNHLDRNARLWLKQTLATYSGSVLIASHDRTLLNDMEQIIEINRQNLKIYGGNYTFYEQQRNAEMELAQKRLEQAKKLTKQVTAEIAQKHDDQQRHAAKRNKQAKTSNLSGFYLGKLKNKATHTMGLHARQRQAQKQQAEAQLQQANEQAEESFNVHLTLPFNRLHASKCVLTIQSMQLALPLPQQNINPKDNSLPPYPKPLSLSLLGSFRLGVLGPNGCGKTTLLKTLAGQLLPKTGYAKIHVPFALLDQNPQNILPANCSVLQQLTQSAIPQSELRTQLALMGLNAQQIEQPAQTLSGGEWLKAALACALWRDNAAQLLLLDEPTNHLDIYALRSLESVLANFPGSIIVVSHDQYFLNALQLTHILSFKNETWEIEDLRSI